MQQSEKYMHFLSFKKTLRTVLKRALLHLGLWGLHMAELPRWKDFFLFLNTRVSPYLQWHSLRATLNEDARSFLMTKPSTHIPLVTVRGDDEKHQNLQRRQQHPDSMNLKGTGLSLTVLKTKTINEGWSQITVHRLYVEIALTFFFKVNWCSFQSKQTVALGGTIDAPSVSDHPPLYKGEPPLFISN